MRILWVKAGKLLPVDTGGKIRSYNILRHLATRHTVTLLSYYGGRRDLGYEAELCRHFPLATPIHIFAPDTNLPAVVVDFARHLLSPLPYAVAKFTSRRVRRLIDLGVREGRYDMAVCDFLAASANFRSMAVPSVLFQHNVESQLWRRQYLYERHALKRLTFALELVKMARYERTAIGGFTHVIAVSERDRERMTQMIGSSQLSVVPTGVDVNWYRTARDHRANQPVVLFLGSMDWEANVDAVDYFCREIWPAVRAAIPAARFRIVGRNPHPRVIRLASESQAIEVTGGVSSVIDYLKEAAVFVVPLRIGGGTRLKIYEAMAAGRAVVSTSIGAEGLDVQHGRDVILADTAPRFAAAVIDLLRDPSERRRLEVAAAERAGRYDWSVVARQFETILLRVAAAEPVARCRKPEAMALRAVSS